MIKRKIHILSLLFLLSLAFTVKAQFYNGYQMSFGKNRVQYHDLEWQYYRFDKFDTYFYVDGAELGQFTSHVAKKKIAEMERFFEYNLEKRIIFQVYNNLTDFRQSNIGLLTGNDENNIGGTTVIVENRVFIYFDKDHKHFEEQITAAIVQVFLQEMFFGGSITSKITSSTLLFLPDWYIKGLIRYLSEGWNTEVDNKVKEAVISGKFDNFSHLEGEDAIIEGQATWHYISEKYGKSVIPNIVYLSWVSKSVESGFMYVLGISFKNLLQDCSYFYKEQYGNDNTYKTEFSDSSKFVRTKKARLYQQMKISPDAKYYAYTSNEIGRYIVWLFDTETHKKRAIVRKEHRLLQITDYSYPLLAWHPSGEKLTFITEEKAGIWFNEYELETQTLTKKRIWKFSKILDYRFAPDGKSIVLSALRKGKVDIYTYSLLSNSYKQITNDDCDDINPAFSKDGTSIIFSSNRLSDSLTAVNTQKYYDLFLFTYGKDSLDRITKTAYADEREAVQFKKNNFLYLSDASGVFNLHLTTYDSTVSFVDTTVHYRYFTKHYPQTNFQNSIYAFDYSSKRKLLNTIMNNKDRNYLLAKHFKPTYKNKFTLSQTSWKKKFIARQKADSLLSLKDSLLKNIEDSLLQSFKDTLPIQEFEEDTNNIDFNHYKFSKNTGATKEDGIDSIQKNNPYGNTREFVPLYYFTSFYGDNVVSQIDFGFLNSTYQPYTGSGVYYSPGFNIFTKLGVTDLFQDYRFTAGVRLSANMNSAEYLFSLEDLKKRLDKQYIFHRQVIEEVGEEMIKKTFSHQLMYLLRYPFNQVSSVRATLQYRNDDGVYLSTGPKSLKMPDDIKNWGGLKLEYIFDNTLPMGINLYRGWRYKIFAEAYKQIDGTHSDLYVLGFDFRHYQKIHRNFIWASRLAASSSYGSNRLMYYLGSTDNWINLSRNNPTFDASVKRNEEINWAFQSLATNMRGFSQNVRNGNTFAVLNNELRFPLIRYFSNKPITSDFLYNLQLISFFDVGTAWTGSSPMDRANKYNQEDVFNGPVTIVIDNQKAPFVYGYGWGVRSRLLGYFVRADFAWGVDGDVVLPQIFYLSLSLDF